MREAFRMLQEEGLIQADPNQRAVVRGMDGEELDQLYSTRIALESLGARITTGRLEQPEVDEITQCLADMAAHLSTDNQTEWMTAHRRFHELCMARAGQPMLRVVNPMPNGANATSGCTGYGILRRMPPGRLDMKPFSKPSWAPTPPCQVP